MNTTLYLLIVEDRHCDVEVVPFARIEGALKEAKSRVQQALERHGMKFPADMLLTDVMTKAGWLYYARSYYDGPVVRVQRAQVRA